MMDWFPLLQQMVCGAIAAAGFGVLFNVSVRLLPWCAASGAAALAVRDCCLNAGVSLEGASFAAALAVSAAVRLLHGRAEFSENALDLVGCIPMVPGSFAAKAIIGLFALVTQRVASDPQALVATLSAAFRVLFTIAAIGTGLAVPALLVRRPATR
jgi:uncharacterized membrane protein YjjB (DUF3815 family)